MTLLILIFHLISMFKKFINMNIKFYANQSKKNGPLTENCKNLEICIINYITNNNLIYQMSSKSLDKI